VRIVGRRNQSADCEFAAMPKRRAAYVADEAARCGDHRDGVKIIIGQRIFVFADDVSTMRGQIFGYTRYFQ
jgi:hypothetical protein